MKHLALLFLLVPCACAGFAPAPVIQWNYILLEESHVVDECLICGRPTIYEPINGQFTLDQGTNSNHYIISDLLFTNSNFTISGSGVINFDSGKQFIRLALEVRKGELIEQLSFTNEVTEVTRSLPMLRFNTIEENGTLVRRYGIGVAAAPIRDLWFSTASQFTSSNLPLEQAVISSGDVLSVTGRRVKHESELVARLGVEDPGAEVSTDALDLAENGEILFSTGQDLLSSTVGPIDEGSLVTDNGRILLNSEHLLAQFVIDPPVENAGLDAIHALNIDEYWFSIRVNIHSTQLGSELSPGDVLSSQGMIVKTSEQLISALNPLDSKATVGLDALYVWPHGEVWFSTESGFDTANGPVSPGDIVSDLGYVAFRNLNLLKPFAPQEDASNFGLDSLAIITDMDARGALLQVSEITAEPGAVRLRWEGTGRAFRVLKSANVNGDYHPLTPVMTEKEWVDSNATSAGFYQIQQW